MSLLDRIIDGAASGDPAELLRNMLVLAKRLKAEEFESWVLAELNGYEGGALPEYRGPFTVPVLANLSGPFGAQGKNYLSRIGLPDEYKALFEVQFSDPMASLVGLAEATDTLTVAWDPWAVGMYNGLIEKGDVPHIEMMGVY